MKETYPFTLPNLPYPYEALEPHIDTETVRIHHDKHMGTYVKKLNEALEKYPQYHHLTLDQLIIRTQHFPAKVRTEIKNNAGGVANHIIYFEAMVPAGNCSDHDAPKLREAIRCCFGSVESFTQRFAAAAASQFGSGYAWLCISRGRQLRIITTANQDSPIAMGLVPIFCIDVWEHAYYLKYQNRRTEYIDNWMPLINWKEAENIFCSGAQNNHNR